MLKFIACRNSQMQLEHKHSQPKFCSNNVFGFVSFIVGGKVAKLFKLFEARKNYGSSNSCQRKANIFRRSLQTI